LTVSTSDYIGIGALITATAAAVVSVIVALRQTSASAQVEEIHTAVSTPGSATIGELAADTNETVKANGT